MSSGKRPRHGAAAEAPIPPMGGTWLPALTLALLLLPGPAGSALLPAAQPAQAGVAFDRNGEAGSWTSGLADPGTGRPVTIDDPVRIASISKLVVAIGVMKLVEEGALALDRDVADYLGWRLRNPHFPDRAITLRQLLTHTSSLRDGDDAYVVPLGGSLRDALTEPALWDEAHGPGDHYFAYANFNFPVIASVMEKVTGERFDLWMRRKVLEPAGIDGCFNWPTCSDAAVARAVVLTSEGVPVRDDLGGRRPDCPVVPDATGGCDLSRWRPGENGALFSPQGGLRISVRGLASIGQLLLAGGSTARGRILSARSVDAILRPHWVFNGTNGSRDGESAGICRYGLGFSELAGAAGCTLDRAAPDRRWGGHRGNAYGLRSGLWIDRERGVGIAYFVTGIPDGAAAAPSGLTAAEEAALTRTAQLLP